MKISVKHNIDEVRRWVNDDVKKQIPFATALALTRTAQECQKEIQASVPEHFNVTKKWWLKQQPTGIKITPAKKAHLVASVYTMAYFAHLQEEGGTKTPFKGKYIAIPTKNTAVRMRKSGGAKAVFSQKNVFVQSVQRFGGADGMKTGIFKRMTKKRLPIKLLFHLRPTAQVKARFGFEGTAREVAQARFKAQLMKALAKAMESKTR